MLPPAANRVLIAPTSARNRQTIVPGKSSAVHLRCNPEAQQRWVGRPAMDRSCG